MRITKNHICSLLLACLVHLSLDLQAQVEETEPTIITSDGLEMQGTPSRNYFYFSGNVLVKGTNLEIRCGELTVVSMREGPEGATIGNIGAIDEIIAQGAVEIHQAGRSAYAGRAEVDPVEGTVTLSENPRIVDREVEVLGYKFVLHKGERKFEVIPDPNAPEDVPSRSVVRLGSMPDMGFDLKEEDITIDDKIEAAPIEEEVIQPEQAGEGDPDDKS